MANEFYITAGLTAIDYADIGSITTNAFYITAGLVANDYVSSTGILKRYSGAAWDQKPVKAYTGAAFVAKPMKRWNGSTWVTVDTTP